MHAETLFFSLYIYIYGLTLIISVKGSLIYLNVFINSKLLQLFNIFTKVI